MKNIEAEWSFGKQKGDLEKIKHREQKAKNAKRKTECRLYNLF